MEKVVKKKKSRIDVYVNEDVQIAFKSYLDNLDEKISASGFLNDYILDVIGNHKLPDHVDRNTAREGKRDCYLNTRLTSAENEGYEKASKAYGFTKRNSLLLKLIREEINRVPDLNLEQIKELREANKNLLGIGRNLNQIAKKMNMDEQHENLITPQYIERLVKTVESHQIAILKMVAFSENRCVVSDSS